MARTKVGPSRAKKKNKKPRRLMIHRVLFLERALAYQSKWLREIDDWIGHGPPDRRKTFADEVRRLTRNQVVLEGLVVRLLREKGGVDAVAHEQASEIA